MTKLKYIFGILRNYSKSLDLEGKYMYMYLRSELVYFLTVHRHL